MRILVTGGSGFIGSHLTPALAREGHYVKVLDLVEPRDSSVDFIRGDIRSYGSALASVKGMDAVVHLAALISVEESMRKPDAYHETNATGSMNMLQACVEGCARRFVYISSAAVYGDPAELPLSEASPVKPISPYGATKLAPEFYASAFRSAFGLETVTLRLFNVYGPDQPLNDYSGVMTKFRERLLAGEAPIIYGDGEQSRSFIHVDDVAKAISLSLSKGVAGETFNIAAGEPVTMNSLAKTMIRLAGKAGLDPVHAPPRTGDIRHSYTKTSKANKLLGFSPSISLEEGLGGLIFR